MSGAIHYEASASREVSPLCVRTCKKCGGLCERVATLPQRLGDTAYDVFQCADCESLEWLAENGPGRGLTQKCGDEESMPLHRHLPE